MSIDIEKAKQIIEENRYMSIATSDNSKPWVSPVFFAYDQHYNLFWVSNKNALHSKIIRKNPQVAIVIFDSSAEEGDGDAVYFEAEAHELENISEIEHAMQVLGKRVTVDEFRVKEVKQVIDDAAWRIYRAVPKVISKCGEGQYINGQHVDNRIELDLQAF